MVFRDTSFLGQTDVTRVTNVKFILNKTTDINWCQSIISQDVNIQRNPRESAAELL